MVSPNNPKYVRRRTIPSKNEMRKPKNALCASGFCNEVLWQNRPCRTGEIFRGDLPFLLVEEALQKGLLLLVVFVHRLIGTGLALFL